MASIGQRNQWIIVGSGILAAALVCAGCALTQKSEPVNLRYFSADLVASGSAHSPATCPTAPPDLSTTEGKGALLRLHNIRAGSHLKSSISYWRTGHEVSFYEERRWVELPEVYLQRMLSQVLFQERGFRRVVAGFAPTLEVELTSFDELREGEPRVRVELSALLYEDGIAEMEQTIAVERPIPQQQPGDHRDRAEILAENLAAALREAVGRVADQVVLAQKAKEVAAAAAANKAAAEADAAATSAPSASAPAGSARPGSARPGGARLPAPPPSAASP